MQDEEKAKNRASFEVRKRAQGKYHDKNKEVGNIRLTIWIPEEDRDKAIKYAERLRKAAGKDLRTEAERAYRERLKLRREEQAEKKRKQKEKKTQNSKKKAA